MYASPVEDYKASRPGLHGNFIWPLEEYYNSFYDS